MARSDPKAHLKAAGYLDKALSIRIVGEGSIAGTFPLEVFTQLHDDPRFANGNLGALHADIGADIHDFRSYRNSFGNGSLQIVMDRTTGAFYADVDAWNPYEDVVNYVGHAFGEVVPHLFKRIFRKKN